MINWAQYYGLTWQTGAELFQGWERCAGSHSTVVILHADHDVAVVAPVGRP